MRYFVLLAVVSLVSCSDKSKAVEEFSLRPLTLPGGKVMQVETAYSNIELLRGLMFRKELAPDRGMLFIYPGPNRYQTVMYNVVIPLDIIWMDADHHIIGIDENAPPCTTQASRCMKYGGKVSSFALEIAAGLSRKYGLKPGDVLQF
ncbi:MAG TPA: DUF192 domain-containing protein [Bryobacteraceae bacterium]|nr:DUF192 domain-containing protein [Bryobacteraceae bacterium]